MNMGKLIDAIKRALGLDDLTPEQNATFDDDVMVYRGIMVGDIVRYNGGSTALMRVTKIISEYSQKLLGGRVYGVQYYGGTVCERINDISISSDADQRKYKAEERMRKIRMERYT